MSKATFSSIEAAAKFCAHLVREGVVFEMRETNDQWVVVLTGGY